MNKKHFLLKGLLISLALNVLCSFFTLGKAPSELNVAPKKFVFMLIHTQEPPFYYSANNLSDYRGIVPDILSGAGRRLNLDISYLPISRNMLETMLLEEKADAFWLTPQWTNNPSKFIFSESAYKQEDFLYSLKHFDAEGTEEDWLRNKSICLRQNYVYPTLQTYIEKGITKRIDVSSQAPMMAMLFKERCELIYLPGYQAEWTAKSLGKSQDIFRSPRPIGTSEVGIVLSKKWQTHITAFDDYILELKNSGEMQKIIQRNMQDLAKEH